MNLYLSQGKVAVLDPADYAAVCEWKWSAHFNRKCWYAVRVENKKMILLHRQIMGVHGQKLPVVDHIDGDGLNNRRSNLRLCTFAQNGANSRRFYGKSRYKGVGLTKEAKPWKARIFKDGKSHFLGQFATEIEAARAYNAAAIRLHGEFAGLNHI